MQIFRKQKRKFDRKKYLTYKKIWNNNVQNIRNIVEDILQSQYSDTRHNLKTDFVLHEENNNNKTLYEVHSESSCDNFITPQRRTIKSPKLLFHENNIQTLCEDIQSENKTNSASCSDNNISDNNSDSSVEFIPDNAKSEIRKKFCILQGQFNIERNNVFDEHEIIDKDYIRETIQNNMVHLLNFPCPLKFYGGIRRNTNFLTAYAKCRYSSHVQQFKFDITNLNSAIIDVFVSSTKCTEITHKGRPIFLTLRGEARDQAKLKMIICPLECCN